MQYRHPPIQEHLVYSPLLCMYMYIYAIYTAHIYIYNPPSNFPYKMGGLKATTKWVFMRHFVVRPPCEKAQGPLCRKKCRGPWMKIEIWSKKGLSKARQFVVKLPRPMADSSRLEPLHFVVNPLCFWKNWNGEKLFIKKNARQV